MAAWQQQVDRDDQEPPGPLLQSVYAQAGTFSNAPAASANDLLAAMYILVFIWAWNCAKYRANLSRFARNRDKYFQNNAALFFSDHPAETRSVSSFPIFEAVFFQPPAPCQMNNPLTPSPQ